MSPDHHTLLFDQASNGGLGTLTATTGKLYAVPIERRRRPRAAAPAVGERRRRRARRLRPGATGHIYIALVGAANQVVELDARGHELARFGQAATGANSSPGAVRLPVRASPSSAPGC